MVVALDVLPLLRFKGIYLLTTLRYTSYHVANALSGSVQFRTSVNGAQCRSLKKAAFLKCLKAQNDIYEWVFGSHFGSLINLEQEMGQSSLMLRSGTMTSVITSGLFVYIYMVNKNGGRLCNSSR